MRWRFIDRITRWEPWMSIEGTKAISLEEYSLLEPWGRKGCLPESLIIESGVHLARWLTLASSSFETTCRLAEIENIAFIHETAPGDQLNLKLTVTERHPSELRLAGTVATGKQLIAQGIWIVTLEPIKETVIAEDMRTLWQELHGTA